MIIMPDPFSLPLLFLVWLLDTYLLMVLLRLVLDQFPKVEHTAFYHYLHCLSEPAWQFAHRLLVQRLHLTVPSWLIWLILIATIYLLKQVLVFLVLN